MLSFEEELEKLGPSKEVSEVEMDLSELKKIPDILDLLIRIVEGKE